MGKNRFTATLNHRIYCRKFMTLSNHTSRDIFASAVAVGDNCLQNCHLGMQILDFVVGNFVFRDSSMRYIPKSWIAVIHILSHNLRYRSRIKPCINFPNPLED